MEVSVSARLHDLWSSFPNDVMKQVAVASGERAIHLMRPVKVDDNRDIVTTLTMGMAVLAALEKCSEGPIPMKAFEAVANSIIAAYGLGLRRGQNKVDESGDVTPFGRRLAEVEQEEWARRRR
jgi:hypothetical protein